MPIPDIFRDMRIGDVLDIIAPPPSPTATGPGPAEGPSDEVRWLAKDKRPRRFVLNRRKDHSGVSGTGYVATGVQFSDGTVAVRWFGKDPSTSLWKDLDALEAVHGHGGSTQIEWID